MSRVSNIVYTRNSKLFGKKKETKQIESSELF